MKHASRRLLIETKLLTDDERCVYAKCFPVGVCAGVTTRAFFPAPRHMHEGTRFLEKIAAAWYADTGVNPLLLHQIHSARVVSARAEVSPQQHKAITYPEADGHFSRGGAECLAVLVADCAAVLLHDCSTGYRAAVHSGWKGTSMNIAGGCVRASFENEWASSDALAAWISPCVRGCCYRVRDDVAALFLSNCEFDYSKWCRYNACDNNYSLDIAEIIQAQLINAGMLPERVYKHPACTMCAQSGGSWLCHSYRRDGGDSGRCMAFIYGT